MCILFVYTNSDPPAGGYRLILASNRDEVFRRPTKEAHEWTEDSKVIGGKDMEKNREGGTWLALSTSPIHHPFYVRIGALLNVTGEPRVLKGRGRGHIVTDYVLGQIGATDYLPKVASHSDEYNAFNFVAIEIGDGITDIYHFSNVNHHQNASESDFSRINYSGICSFGNSLPDAPLTKVRIGEERFKDIVDRYSNSTEDRNKLTEELFYLLKWEDRHLPDAELEKRAPDWKDYLSSIYVNITEAGYGTRTHTVILIDESGNVDYLEDTMQDPIEIDQPVWRLKRLVCHI